MKRIALLVVTVAAIVACDSPTASADMDVDLRFGVQRIQTEPAFQVQRDDGVVTVRGYFETLCSPSAATARAEVIGRVLTVRIAGHSADACYPVVLPVGYEAIVRDVPAGDVRVRIVHEWPATGRSPQAVAEAVTH